MTLRLAENWLWDFWLAQDGPDHHIFYLQAPRSLGDERLRHRNVSIGHAVSQDLCNWEVLPDAIHPSGDETDTWDNYTTWTGSIIRHKSLWFMFYTGGNREENALIQRIGYATSDDLIRWKKNPSNPTLLADPQWYELLDLNIWHDQAWRDPWVFKHPTEDTFHALITARANHGPSDGRGVIGHARSRDLVDWEVLQPLYSPGLFGHLEVPQLTEIHGRFYLLFSTGADQHAPHWSEVSGSPPATTTYYLTAAGPLGPFSPMPTRLGDLHGSHYSGKLVKGPGGEWTYLAYRHFNAEGAFVGELDDPVPVEIASGGTLCLASTLER